MKSLTELENIKGKKILVRVDYNVPVTDGKVLDEDADRILASFETIDYLATSGAKVILISHFGRDGESLAAVSEFLKTKRSTSFVPDLLGDLAKNAIEEMTDGDILLLENLRRNPGEEGNDAAFVDALSALGEVFVNDAFSASHREHASIVGLPAKLPAYAGFLFEREHEALSQILFPKKPFVLIVGGAKFDTKLPILEKFLTIADTIVVGGALANTLLSKRGYPIGKSLVDDSEDVSQILASPNLFLPDRVMVERGGIVREVAVNDVITEDVIMDLAPVALDRLAPILANAVTILWNGPLGFYEKKYTASSERLVSLVRQSKAYSVAGGGDTVSMLRAKKLTESFSFVSLSGGAMLEFLADGTLPGIDALFSAR